MKRHRRQVDSAGATDIINGPTPVDAGRDVAVLEGPSTRTRREVLGDGLAGAAAIGLTVGLGGAACSASQTTPPTSSTASLGATTTVSPGMTKTIPRGKTKIVVLGSQGGQQITQLTGANVRCGTSVLIDVDGELTAADRGGPPDLRWSDV